MVLVHGGGFAASCWDPMLPFVATETVAVDLPGRGRRPADVTRLGVDDFADAVVDEIETRDLHDVVLVGHSLAGVTLPRVAGRIPERLARLVFVACTVPRDGESVLETLTGRVHDVAARAEQLPASAPLDPSIAVPMFCNDMDDAQVARTLALMVPEAMSVIVAPNDLSGLRHGTPRTWVRLLRDQAVPLPKQDEFVANIGGADVVELDAAHMAMISAPDRLAAVLDDVAASAGRVGER